jgi:AAT family amino acid transporter/lysine-specific permease
MEIAPWVERCATPETAAAPDAGYPGYVARPANTTPGV